MPARDRQDPVDHSVNEAIAECYYQKRAIASICDAFEHGSRRGLLATATGAGKTRTAIALVDVLMRANRVKRVLFLADRITLVKQAANAFKEHLPGVATVNPVIERNADGRVYVSTYPIMMGLIDKGQGEDGGELRRFGVGPSIWSSSTRRTAACTRNMALSSITSTGSDRVFNRSASSR